MSLDRRAWLGLLLCILVAGGGGYAVFDYLSQRHQRHERLLAEVRELQQELMRRREGMEIAARMRAAFLEGEKKGWWVPQDRFAWVAESRRIATMVGIPLLHYRLSPPHRLPIEGGVMLQIIEIDLDLGLVHEGGLLDFWRMLTVSVPGLFSLETCRVERSGGVPKPGKVNLNAHCRLHWYALTLGDGGNADRGLDRDIDDTGGMPL